MLENGNYSAWFRIQQGEATGVVVLNDGRVTGGDNVSSYSGSYFVDGDKFTAAISTWRHTQGTAFRFRHRQRRSDTDRQIHTDDRVMYWNCQTSPKPDLRGHPDPYRRATERASPRANPWRRNIAAAQFERTRAAPAVGGALGTPGD